MSNFPIYNATIHPGDWLNQVQTQCIISGIRNDKEVLKLCKLNIDNAITVPEVNSTAELVTALKSLPSFNVFKNSCKAKLDAMRYENDENADTASFLADVRKLISDAEIDNPEDVKRRLLNTYSSNDFFRNEFARRVTRDTSIGDMYKIYSEVVVDGSKIIKFVVGDIAAEDFKFGTEQLITLKHVATGRYLSSTDVNYQTGSQRQVAFCGEKLPNEDSAWYLTYESGDKAPQREGYQSDIVLYEDLIILNHRKTKTTLSLNDYYKSPVSGKAEVHCYPFIASDLRPVKPSQSSNKTSYLKMGDTIHIKSEDSNMTLGSLGVNFTIDDKDYQEVDGHREKVGKDDEWRVERYR